MASIASFTRRSLMRLVKKSRRGVQPLRFLRNRFANFRLLGCRGRVSRPTNLPPRGKVDSKNVQEWTFLKTDEGKRKKNVPSSVKNQRFLPAVSSGVIAPGNHGSRWASPLSPRGKTQRLRRWGYGNAPRNGNLFAKTRNLPNLL